MREACERPSAGVLLPITALPSAWGIGCMGREARMFAELLSRGGQRYWQMLPLGPTGYGDSPYQSFSTFAGNPYLIDLEPLIEAELLDRRECEAVFRGASADRVDYALQYRGRMALLRRAHHAFCRMAGARERAALEAFGREMADWLPDYAHFMALKQAHGGTPCVAWERALVLRKRDAMEHSRHALAKEIDFYRFLQFAFYTQWDALHRHAAHCRLSVIGDLPIYVSADSADVWSHPELFLVDEGLRPLAVAGCPPDGFSERGQLWGNPLYRWEEHAATGYGWWIRRLRHCFRLFDVVRIDHFRGFASYYSIPGDARDATRGEWVRGPGAALFRAVEGALGRRAIIAEDLGYMSEEVAALLRECGFPGMRVLQFGFDGRDGGNAAYHLPHSYPEHCVAYTGTHDNQTLAGWLREIPACEMAALRRYLCDVDTPCARLPLALIALLLRSRANLVIIPLQDYLGIGDEGRINTPSTQGINWLWRVRERDLNAGLERLLADMATMYGRSSEHTTPAGQ